MLNKSDFEQIVSQVVAGHLEVLLRYDGDRPYIQVGCDNAIDAKTGMKTSWTGRKWMLSPHMVKSEVVRTIYKAYHAALMHEADETFLYKEIAIYSPHYDVDQLADCLKEDARINGMSGA